MRRSLGRVVVCAALVLLAAACGGAAGGGLRSSEPPPVLLSFDTAAVVFGQPVFALADANQGRDAPSGATLTRPGLPSTEPLFLPDIDNHRVLGFRDVPILSNLSAHYVLGQPGDTFAFPGVGATALRSPTCARVAGGRLLVSDSGNHRVLGWSTLPKASAAPADLVLGQTDFLGRSAGTGPAGMTDPAGLCVVGDRVFVVDRGNHRVLVWTSLPQTSGQPADLVLGQPDAATNLPNRGLVPTPDSLFDPCAVWSDGTRVVVVDRGNHRVLVWSVMPGGDGQSADFVLGQPDLATTEAGLGALRLDRPSDVASDGTRLFVADAGNHRILVWNAFPTAPQVPPDRVLGQSDFDHGAPNDDDQDGLEDTAPSARTFKGQDGALWVSITGSSVCVGDVGNHRLLVFRGI